MPERAVVLLGRPIISEMVALQDDANGTCSSWTQLLKTGSWKLPDRELDVTPTTLAEIIENAQSDGQDIPLDYDHLTLKAQKPEDGKAAGWIKPADLELRADGKELWGLVEWTQRAKELIEAKEYRFISPTFFAKWFHPEKKKFVGARLIMAAITNIPFLKGMAPLALSEFAIALDESSLSLSEKQNRIGNALYKKYEHTTEGFYIVDMFDDHVIIRKGDKLLKLPFTWSEDYVPVFDDEAKEVVSQYVELTEENKELSVPEEKKPEEKKIDAPEIGKAPEVIALNEQIATLSTGLNQLREEVVSERTARVAAETALNSERAGRRVSELIRSGKLLKAQEDWAKAYALSDNTGFEKFAATLVPSIALNKQHGVNSTDDTEESTKDPVIEMNEKVTAYAKEHSVKFGEAMRQVSIENPDLAEAYRAGFAG